MFNQCLATSRTCYTGKSRNVFFAQSEKRNNL
nr:MAG TPA: hypothetical protein [Caudoviricetes sp.]